MTIPRTSGQPTINDVAARAGVSKKTVSRVINRSPSLSGKTRAKVEAAIGELGFVPNTQARALAFRRNFLIALLHDNPNAQTVLNFQRGVLSAIGGGDLALAVRPVDRNSPAMLSDIETFLAKQRPMGVLFLPPISERDDLAALCQRLGVRYVRVGSAPLDEADRCVSSNDRRIVAEAVRHMIGRGHRRIGFVRGPEGFRSAAEREAGFRDAMREAGLAIDPAHCTPGSYRFGSGLEAGDRLLSAATPPTAVFCSNDEMAAGVLFAARERGVPVPERLSIMGFDDSPTASHVWPLLSTVHWPIEDMGRIAAQKLVPEHVELPPGGVDELPLMVPSHLMERGSVVDAID